MRALLSDPRALNALLLVIYLANTARWLYEGRFPQALYWFGAGCIIIGVTWGMGR